jgi:hypothetical protein
MDIAKQEYWIKKKQEEWEKISTFGRRFEEEDRSGYFYKGKKHYDWIRGPTITGPGFPFPEQPIIKSPNPWKGIK